jgi:DNA-directed RNA polymerase subunit beta
METPHYLDVQIQAFERLLEPDTETDRRDVGLDRVFKEIFPIEDVNGNFSLEFQDYSLGEPKYSVDECMERDMTYAAPLKATLRLVVWEDLGDDERRPADILEKEVYLGDLPLLTEHGTFVVNGAERVIVSQLHRSPGVVFEETVHPNGTRLFSARIIPFRGSWVEFTLDIHDVIYVHIDKRKKFPATALLRALGYGTDADILDLFYERREVLLGEIAEDRTARREVTGTPVVESVLDAEFEGEPRTQSLSAFDPAKSEPMWLADDVVRPGGKKSERVILAMQGEKLDDTLQRRFVAAGLDEVPVFDDPAAFIARRGDDLSDELFDRLLRAGVERIEVYSSAAFIATRGSYEDLAMRRDWSQKPTLAGDVVDPRKGDVVARRGEEFTSELFGELKRRRIREAMVFTGGPRGESPLIKNTLAKDPTRGEADALRNIYSLVRPGEAPNIETARTALDRLFFNPKRYDLGRVGRHKVNHRLRDVYRLLGIEIPDSNTTVLAPSDFVAIVRYMVELNEGRGFTDDIDHLGNRRVRSIGELIANQFSVGL